ncbi:MAG: phosphoribosylaminoimidazolecarboxamide formyltransferase [Lachnospiraceae bacterium]|jgi:phosphoribosylaminoimidazolecarboxamide formyltransferase/IMP cyclohydrolase|nr:phosphoribosylaminoimidazolecarboxamide formyltransferase [Lachnospiraceae bacterium]MEE3460803.1 phosphoribosylaminoimidazolecarboxamide formyltransferase [Lachnospiraceae bacterium]
MNEIELKYGTNPNQKPARIFMQDGRDLPVEVLNGKPGYINFLDALNGWQLVSQLKKATGYPAATSFKHVSPAGAAIGLPLSDVLKKIYWVDDLGELSPLASAYARARGADRMSSYGDFIALSDVCDVSTAKLIKREFSDGIIAPGYEPEALELLKGKKKGNYAVIKIDPDFVPAPLEHKDVYGITFEQGRNELNITPDFFDNIVTDNKDLPLEAKHDMAIAMITLKYTQSNSVCFVKDGQAIGIGAGQQSRIHCTRLAGSKADKWFLRQCPKVLDLPFKEDMKRADRDNAIDLYTGEDYEDILRDGAWQRVFTEKPEVFTEEEKKAWLNKAEKDVTCGSDAFFPFDDNIERAFRSGAKYIAQPGGSIRDQDCIDACNRHNMVMSFTGIRLFHH